MEMVDISQKELDLFEQAVLTDLFGGYSQDKFIYRSGFLKLDLTKKVQTIITKFENFVRPLLDDEGYINSETIQSYLNEEYIKIPQGRYRLIELYRDYQPYILQLTTLFKELG